MGNNIVFVLSKELILEEIKKIKDNGESEILSLGVEYSSQRTEKCFYISQNLSKYLFKEQIINNKKILDLFSLERQFDEVEIGNDISESQKKLASELTLDSEESVFYIGNNDEELKLIAINYQIDVLNVSEAIEKIDANLST